MRVFLLASLVCATTIALPTTCKVGQKVTENYVRYKCVGGKLVAESCSVTNKNFGNIITPGNRMQIGQAFYDCKKVGSSLKYEVVGCAYDGQLIPIGRPMQTPQGEGSCVRVGENKVEMKINKRCVYNGAAIALGQTVDVEGTVKQMHRGRQILVQKGVRMQCTTDSFQRIVVTAKGCLLPSNQVLSENARGSVEGAEVVCSALRDTLTVKLLATEATACVHNGATYEHGASIPSTTETLVCETGRVKKTGCLVDGGQLPVGDHVLGPTLYSCSQTVGQAAEKRSAPKCTLPDGRAFLVDSEFTLVGEERPMTCVLMGSRSGQDLTAIQQTGCTYKGVTIPINTVQKISGRSVECRFENTRDSFGVDVYRAVEKQ